MILTELTVRLKSVPLSISGFELISKYFHAYIQN